MTHKASDLAYIAGFFDGEGCVSFRKPHPSRNRITYAVISISQKDPTVLEWIQKELGMGNIGHNGTVHNLVIGRLIHIRRFARLIHPYSRCPRRRRLLAEAYMVSRRDS